MPPADHSSRRRRAHRLAVSLPLWAGVFCAVLGLAFVLDQPSGPGEVDTARPVSPGVSADGSDTHLADLPPLALVLDRPLPDAVAEMPPARATAVLGRRAARTGDPGHLVEWGVALQQADRHADAGRAFAAALRRREGDIDARIGRILAASRSGGTLADAARALDALAAARPGDQAVAFHRGWVAFYRLDPEASRAELARALALGAQTRRGRAAQALIEALDEGALGGGP